MAVSVCNMNFSGGYLPWRDRKEMFGNRRAFGVHGYPTNLYVPSDKYMAIGLSRHGVNS